MAAVAAAPVEDDEEWLYGGAENAENKAPAGSKTSGKIDKEEGEMSGEEASQDKTNNDDSDEDDSDDDDDVQVTIGDIKAFPLNDAGPRIFKGSGPYQKPTSAAAAGQKISTTGGAATTKGVDVEAEGTINGVGVFEFNLDTLTDEDKPWRKPGADITDYFNYGFTEDTWKMYCHKQNRLRGENGAPVPRPILHMGSSQLSSSLASTGIRHDVTSKVETLHPPGTQNNISALKVLTNKTTPPAPMRKMSGTIDVIGSTARDSRRPQEEEGQSISVAGPDMSKHFTSVPPPGLPPPGMSMGMGMPPPDYSIPPPGIMSMPPGMHSGPPPPPGMSVPPPMFHPPPDMNPYFHQHPPSGPPPDTRPYSDRPAPFGGFDNTHPTTPSYPDTGPAWESGDSRTWEYGRDGRDRERERERFRERSPAPSEPTSRDYYRGDREQRRERSRSREKDRDRDRDRDRRHRDKERDRERDRTERERDDKHKSRRKTSKPDTGEDSDYHKSKHKKSKRSKRDKDDDQYDPSNPSHDDAAKS